MAPISLVEKGKSVPSVKSVVERSFYFAMIGR